MNNSKKTAIKRNKLSAPTRWLHENEKLSVIMLDYGCGRGDDAQLLSNLYGYYCTGYDPNWDEHNEPDLLDYHYEVVVCNYVLNVLNPDERQKVLDSLAKLNADAVYVTVRRDLKKEHTKTSIGTEQWLVYLDYPVVKQTSGFCIYKLR